MKTKTIVLIVLLNIFLFVADFVVLKWYFEGRQNKKQTPAQIKAELAAWKEKVAPPAAATAQAKIIYRTNTFHWSQVESADYRQYIANLRQIGCPEQTIRDLVLTDVMRLYAGMRGKASVNGRAFKFWETEDKRKLHQQQLEDRDKQLAQIDKDLPNVLRELLGINYERELDKYFIDTGDEAQRLGFLPPAKRDQLLALRDQLEGQREAVMNESADGKLTAGQIERLKKIDSDREQQLSQLLTPQEKETYELSTSETADKLRKELVGFNPSEAEFREIFRKRLLIDQNYAYSDLNDEATRQAKAAEEKKVNQEVAGQFDANRAIEFQRSQNEDYRNLYTLAQRFDLPDTTAQSLLDMRQIAEEQKRRVENATDLSDDKKAETLKAIQVETERTLVETLGVKGFGVYNETTGNWLGTLTR